MSLHDAAAASFISFFHCFRHFWVRSEGIQGSICSKTPRNGTEMREKQFSPKWTDRGFGNLFSGNFGSHFDVRLKMLRSLKNELIFTHCLFSLVGSKSDAHFQFSFLYRNFEKNEGKGKNVMEQLAHNMIIIFSLFFFLLPFFKSMHSLVPAQFWVSLWKRR